MSTEPKNLTPEPPTIIPSEPTGSRKRSAANSIDSEQKKLNLDGKPSLESKLKTQIEYYLSDDNLRFDKFFHGKISENEGSWLEYSYIMSCQRIVELGATVEMIQSTLEGSDKVEVSDIGVRRQGQAPLPELKERKPRGGTATAIPFDELHAAGCFLKISGIPPSATFTQIKEALVTILPDTNSIMDVDNTPYQHSRIVNFVSNPNDQGIAYAYLTQWQGDIEMLKELPGITLEGVICSVELVTAPADTRAAVNCLPRLIANRRLGRIKKNRSEASSTEASVPTGITIASSNFKDVEHLRRSLVEILNFVGLGDQINKMAHDVIIELLKSLPDGNELVNKIVSIISGGSEADRKFFGKTADGCEIELPISEAINARYA